MFLNGNWIPNGIDSWHIVVVCFILLLSDARLSNLEFSSLIFKSYLNSSWDDLWLSVSGCVMWPWPQAGNQYFVPYILSHVEHSHISLMSTLCTWVKYFEHTGRRTPSCFMIHFLLDSDFLLWHCWYSRKDLVLCWFALGFCISLLGTS